MDFISPLSMGKAHDIEIVKTDLQIEEEIDAHKKGWTTQRIGLVFMYIFVLAAAAGLFGNGPASKNTESAQQIEVESERFYRFHAEMPLKISADNISDNKLTVSFPSDYLTHFEIESIVPEPRDNRLSNGEVHYSFDAAGRADVTFYLIPQQRGNISGSLDVNGQRFELKHYIFP